MQSDFVARQCSTHCKCRKKKYVKDILSVFQWQVLSYAAYSLDCASDYHLFRCNTALLISKHMKKLKNGSMNGLLRRTFFYRGIHFVPEKWEKVIVMKNVLNKILNKLI